MHPEFQVSVIMPVYNAEEFLNTAVESAVHNNYVGEILLIEDKSPDNCLQICKELVGKYDKVKLFRHPNGENRGAGASRNLGILNAMCDYVAFLDADDYYLPERFENAKKNFQDASVQYSFGTAQYDKEFLNGTGNYKQMVIKSDDNEKIFNNLLFGGHGYFHTNAITIRKSILQGVKLFDPQLKLHQDSEFWLRLSYQYKGAPEELNKTIAVVRQHENNRISHKNDKSLFLFWHTIKKEFTDKDLTYQQRKTIELYNRLFKGSSNPIINKLNNYILRLQLKLLK